MNESGIYAIIGLFLITIITNIFATLKTMLMSKKIMNPVYLLVFADALIFTTVINQITSSQGIHYTMAYALGRTLGVYVGGKFEARMALGILEVDLFLNHKDKMIEVAERLRNVGYTVNNYLARGNNGERRYKVEVVIKRSELKILEKVMEECGVTNPTLKIKNLNQVYGKITSTQIKAT